MSVEWIDVARLNVPMPLELFSRALGALAAEFPEARARFEQDALVIRVQVTEKGPSHEPI